MSEIDKATPRPWNVEDPMGDDCPWIVEAGKETYDWRCIAMVPSGDSDERPRISKASAQANAALIVRAVNERDGLIMRHDRALDDNQKLRDEVERLRALLRELTDIEGPCPGTAEWAEKVRVVLAKVQS